MICILSNVLGKVLQKQSQVRNSCLCDLLKECSQEGSEGSKVEQEMKVKHE